MTAADHLAPLSGPAADPLALPPVPPPAADAHRRRDRIVALLFVLATALPGIAAFVGPGERVLSFENRAAARWPALPPATGFTTAVERAFADRFGGRNRLIEAHHRLLVDAFAMSPAPNVMIGRDGWLFFLGEDGRSLDRHYRGAIVTGDAEIAAVVAELRRRARFLAEVGIPYVVTIVPDKFTIYPEMLPAWVAPAKTATPLDRLAAALAVTPGLRFVDLRAPLLAAKARERVYYATDSHWNYAGAIVGYGELMRAVQDALPPGSLPQVAPAMRPPYVPGQDTWWGDLSRQIGLVRRFTEPDYLPFAKVLGDASSRCGRRIDAGKDEGFEFYACDRPGLPRAVVYRDSMAIPLIPLLSENFGRVVYVGSRRLDPALIRRERPDLVIEEMVERSLLAPAALPMPDP